MLRVSSNSNELLQYLKSLTIMCVEDDETTRLIYDIIFKDLTKKIIFASDGKDGYKNFINKKIDIIITDYSMPILNGLDMSEKIRLIDKSIPIILVSWIDEVDIIIRALNLKINHFIKKPIINNELIEVVLNASKVLIADDYLKQQRDKKIKNLENKEKYSQYQEDLAFNKELNLLRNDFYYKMLEIKEDSISFVDFLYNPLDTLSGDAYAARKIDKFKTFYLIVDGMGKGLSASFTAILMTSFINNSIDIMLEKNDFNLHTLINESLNYIKKILLDEEALSMDYIVINKKNLKIFYAKFSMPVSFMQNSRGEVIRLKSNNPPISKYNNNFKISDYDINQIDKFLFYSDGIVENTTMCDKKTYSEFIENDFKNSLTKKEFTDNLFKKISSQEDDLTIIFISKVSLTKDTCIGQNSFASSLKNIDKANKWYADILNKACSNKNTIYEADLVFNELFMNAYEHGNLGIDLVQKHKLIDEDLYFNKLLEYEKKCSKKITVKIDKITNDSSYIITQICDEGKGFDTNILADIFRHSKSFNGRGVFVSRNNSMGIYYNSFGNTVVYINKI